MSALRVRLRADEASRRPGTRNGYKIVVESLALAVADPPPNTLTWFTCGKLALAATFTVTVIAG